MIPYSFYSGCGNRFALIDNRTKHVLENKTNWIPRLCMATQPSADGVIIAERSSIGDAKMRIFNRDGSEAEMCGNGLRVFIRFLAELGLVQKNYKIETLAVERMGLFEGEIINDEVEVLMGKPHSFEWDVPISIDNKVHNIQFLNTGVPHSVLMVPSLDHLPIDTLGRQIRYHPQFEPQGTNVTFMSQTGKHSISVRVYERGVEAETQACGTGAVAASVVAALKLGLTPPIEVTFVSKETISIFFSHEASETSKVRMRGPAKKIGQGYFVF